MLKRLILAAMLAATPALAQDPAAEEAIYGQIEEIHGDAGGFLTYAAALSEAVGQGDSEAFAALLEYPVEVGANGEVYEIPDAERFVQDYETLMQGEIQVDLVDWTLGDTVVTSEGVGIMGGRIWFANQCIDDGCTETKWFVSRISND